MLNLELMKARLKEMNTSLVELANATGLSYSVITKIFTGIQTNPTYSTIMPICKYLGLQFDKLWVDSDEQKPTQRVENVKIITVPIRETGAKELDHIISRILNVIKNKEMSLAKIEKELGFESGEIKNFKNNIPSAVKIKRLAERLNVSADYLLGLTESPRKYHTLRNSLDKLSKEKIKHVHEYVEKLVTELPNQGEVVVIGGKEFVVDGVDGDTLKIKRKPT